MIEVKDEALAGEPRYRATDGNGNILMDNFTFEMITEIAQTGTPINKVLFDSIKHDLEQIYSYSQLASSRNVPAIHVSNNTNNLNIPLPLHNYVNNQLIKLRVEPTNFVELPSNWLSDTSYFEGSVFPGFGSSMVGVSKNYETTIKCNNLIKPGEVNIQISASERTSAGISLLGSNDGVTWEIISSDVKTVNASYNTFILSPADNVKTYLFLKLTVWCEDTYSGYFNLKNGVMTGAMASDYNIKNTNVISVGNLASREIVGEILPYTNYTIVDIDGMFYIEE